MKKLSEAFTIQFLCADSFFLCLAHRLYVQSGGYSGWYDVVDGQKYRLPDGFLLNATLNTTENSTQNGDAMHAEEIPMLRSNKIPSLSQVPLSPDSIALLQHTHVFQVLLGLLSFVVPCVCRQLAVLDSSFSHVQRERGHMRAFAFDLAPETSDFFCFRSGFASLVYKQQRTRKDFTSRLCAHAIHKKVLPQRQHWRGQVQICEPVIQWVC